ncbi:sporulation histidine kinase inhibitor Sda [Bacillus sp. J33]|uniref:sporulation histidine kinase inhibitor Sda n=1 Tax=Bacillus sp. J33 TaxID=935836 RepID=UPI0004B58F97|nr:sporulation histidine kinase inhibitor Sda [Bacillus sp. J33]
MTIQTMPDKLLISAYLDAVRLKLNNEFIELLFSEIERRNIKHLLPKDFKN